MRSFSRSLSFHKEKTMTNHSIDRLTSTSNDEPAYKPINGESQIAIAIDFDSPQECNNPCITAVPIGLGPQDILNRIYKEYIADALESGMEPEDVPYYRFAYLWYGGIIADAKVIGAECTEEYASIHPPDELKFESMVEEVKKELEGHDGTAE